MSDETRLDQYTLATPPAAEKVATIDGFVALIDVLGFRELVGRDDNLSALKEYIETVALLLQGSNFSQLEFVLFSDNIVINTIDQKEQSFVELVRACSQIFYELTKRQVALRGAIAHGRFMRSPNAQQGVIVAGSPIVEAYRYQTYQDWVGIMLAPSVMRRRDDLHIGSSLVMPTSGESAPHWYSRAGLAVHLAWCQRIPFHDGAYEGHAIVPIRADSHTAASIRASLRDTNEQLSRMKAVAPDPISQKKYSNTLEWLSEREGYWGNMAKTTAFQQIP
jgi:hypothetical protein